MNASPRWRRFAVKLAQHAASVLPAASPWAKAMRRELDYIEDDRAALRWALGCVLASYKTGLAARAENGLGRSRTGEFLRHATASGALMLVIGLALLENAGGQTVPPASSPPVLNKTACEIADKAPEGAANPGRTQRPGSVRGTDAFPPASMPETACTDRNAPVRVLPKHDTP